MKFVQTPFATMGDQLDAGNVDAVVASIPFSGTIAARGYTLREDVIVEAVDAASNGAVQTAMTTVWASTRAFADAHPDTIRAWRSALGEAIAYLDADEARARQHDAGLHTASGLGARTLGAARLVRRGDAAGSGALRRHHQDGRLDQRRTRRECAGVATPMTAELFAVDGVGVDLRTPGGPRAVLRDVWFDIGHGDVVGVVGRSGAGKTTLLRVLGGLLEYSCGTVVFDGEVVRGPPHGAVMVFQDYENALLPWRTVARNAALGLEGRVGRDIRHERVAQALAMVELSDHVADYPRHLSGGMAQRAPVSHEPWCWNQRCS